MKDSDKSGHRERLRERFTRAGLEGFHNYETLELLLTYAIPRRDVKPLAKELVREFGTLRGVMDASREKLQRVNGIGENAAILLCLIKEISGSYLKERIMGRDAVTSAEDVIGFLDMTLSGENIEKFLGLYLNAKNEILAVEVLHEGTIDSTVVYPRKAIEFAIAHNAKSVIFVHNHPSGDPTPSRSDHALTLSLLKAATPMNIKIHDHIIIGKKGYYSTQEEGEMPVVR
ncbi:MAG: DNA repair protein RadC [Deltaproteobacteria bacterium]|nr:DNA repair protein RadC [Deltaproteobacteria bacterium]